MYVLFSALSVRKVIYTFLLFVELHMVATLMMFFFYLAIFTMSSPTGLGLGILLTYFSPGTDQAHLALSVVQGNKLFNTMKIACDSY